MEKGFFDDKDYRLWARLNQVRDSIWRARHKELGRIGILPTEARVLTLINEIDSPVTPIDISRWLVREPQTISSLLRKMETEGLIKRTRDMERKNMIRVSLTEKGQRTCEQVAKFKTIHRIFSTLSEEQREQLISNLELILKKSLGKNLYWDPFP